MISHPPKIKSIFEAVTLKLPLYLGLPVMENGEDQNDSYPVQLYVSLLVFAISLTIFCLPKEWSTIITYLMGFSSDKLPQWKLTTAITSIFVHKNFAHLLGNMYFYLMFAPLVEKKFGPYNFLIAFLFCSVISNVGTLLFLNKFMSIGASGTISGFMAMIAIAEPNLKFRFYHFFVVPGWVLVVFFFFIPDFMSVLRTVPGKMNAVNHYAHLFGFLAGYLLSLLIQPMEENERRKQNSTINDYLTFSLWGSLFLAIVFPAIVFFIGGKTFERLIWAIMNMFVYSKTNAFFAIAWAIVFIVIQHQKKLEQNDVMIQLTKP